MKHIYSILFFLFVGILHAQEISVPPSQCSTPDLPMPAADARAYINAMEQDRAAYRINGNSIVIPTVIHNIHYRMSGYLSDEVILRAFEQVNDGLANRGDFYDPLGVDTGIRLCLAKIDPNGNASTGILHTENEWALHEDNLRDSINLFNDSTLQWMPDQYFNVYLSEANLGVGTFPWNEYVSNFNGIQVHSANIGRKAGIITWLHEIGHYLGLYHTFGMSNVTCSNSNCLVKNDRVCDTRPDKLMYSPCLPYNSCFSDAWEADSNSILTTDEVDMVENYMDGSPCRTRFTQGQVDRMHWALATYREELTQNTADRCRDCRSISVNFKRSTPSTTIGQSINFFNLSPQVNRFQWWVNDSLVSTESSYTLSPTEAGLYRIRLAVQDSLDECAVWWTREKSVVFRCGVEDVFFHQADYYEADSCYVLSVDGVAHLKWQWQGENVSGTKFDLCTEEVGVYPLIISDETAACPYQDTFWINVLPKTKKVRSYERQRILFYPDSTYFTYVMRNVHKRPNQFIYSGRTTYSFFSEGRDPEQCNFIRYWQPMGNVLEELTLLEAADSLRKIELLDIQEDEAGNIYFLAAQTYRRKNYEWSYGVKYIIGKLNPLHQVCWAKYFIWDDYSASTLRLDKRSTKFISPILDDETFFMVIQNTFYQLNTKGELLKSKFLRVPPYEVYADHSLVNYGNFEWRNDRIWFIASGGRIYFEDYEPYTDNAYSANRTVITLCQMDTSLMSTQSISFGGVKYEDRYTYKGPYSSHIKMSYHPSGNFIITWRSRWVVMQTDDDNNDIINVAMISPSSEILWLKAIEDGRPGNKWLHPTLRCLNNGDILLNTELFDDEKKTAMGLYRISAAGEILDTQIYPPEKDISVSGGQVGREQGILAEDGILHQREWRIDNYMHRLPINGAYACDTVAMPTVLHSNTLDRVEDAVEYVIDPIQTRLEEMVLAVEKRRLFDFETTICEHTIEIDDYAISIQDTSYFCPDSIQVDVMICRKGIAETDTVQVALFPDHPIEMATTPLHTQAVPFAIGQSCQTIPIPISQSGEHHILVNARTDYPTPYTLLPTFFDGHIKPEFDYRNNHVVIKGECLSTATTAINSPQPKVRIFPNPSQDQLNIQVEHGQLKQVILFNMLGQLFESKEVYSSQDILKVGNYPSGIYLLHIQLANEQWYLEKVVVE